MRLVIILLSLFLIIKIASAQTDSTEFVFGVPITDNDSADQPAAVDFAPTAKVQKLKIDGVPAAIRETLKEDDLYKGWETQTFYRDLNTGQYILQFNTGRTLKRYYFNKAGKAVTLSEEDIPEKKGDSFEESPN